MRAGVACLTLLLPLVSLPDAAAADYRWARETVCVERHLDRYWGIGNAVAIWNEVDAGQPQLLIREDCPYYGSIHIRDAWAPNWGYGGMAWTTTLDGRIIRARIRLNNAAPVGLLGDRPRHWKRFVSGHEIGHALGLHHNTTPGSIMCSSTDWYANDGSLHWTDRRNLHRLYD